MPSALPQLLTAAPKPAVTAARDLLTPTSGPEHGDAFAEALAQARSRTEGRRRTDAAAARDERPQAVESAPGSSAPVTTAADSAAPAAEPTAGEPTDEDPDAPAGAQGAADAQATQHADAHAFASQGLPFREAPTATAAATPTATEGVEVAPAVTAVAAAAPAGPTATGQATPLEGTPVDPTVPPAPPTGEASATGQAAGATTDLSAPVDGRVTDAHATTPVASGPVVEGQPSAEPAATTGTGPDTATAATSQGGTDTGAGEQPTDRSADQGRHLGQEHRTEAGQPLVVGRELGAAGGQHLGRTAGPRSEEALTGPTVTGVTGATAPAAPTAPAAATSAAPATAPVAVPEQVFASLGRLVSRGDGTHRLTIKLQPEALGEVRVVLTVRDGDVSVRLTGSEAAQRALLQGAGDLQRLLESVGAKSAQVVVGDPTGGGVDSGAGQSGWGRPSQDRPGAPSYAPEHPGRPAPDPTPTRARTRQSVLDVTV